MWYVWKTANSECNLKVDKGKWHTNVAHYEGNITKTPAFWREIYAECLICDKQFDATEKLIKGEQNLIYVEATKKGLFNQSDWMIFLL